MKPLRYLATLAAGLFLAVAVAAPAPEAEAATQNYSIAIPGVQVIPIHLSGQYTATTAAVATIKLPFPATLVAVSAVARANGANSPTLTVDFLAGGVSLLSAPISVTSGTVTEGTVATAAIADEAVLTVNLAIGGGGGSPTWNDIDVLVTIIRK